MAEFAAPTIVNNTVTCAMSSHADHCRNNRKGLGRLPDLIPLLYRGGNQGLEREVPCTRSHI